jgi:hypothetical protein
MFQTRRPRRTQLINRGTPDVRLYGDDIGLFRLDFVRREYALRALLVINQWHGPHNAHTQRIANLMLPKAAKDIPSFNLLCCSMLLLTE